MTTKGAKASLITAAMIVAGIRLYLQIRGKATTPIQEWVVGWGATFFVLSLLAEPAPTAAGSLALVIAFADFLKNGIALTTDLEDIVSGQASGEKLLVDNPLSTDPNTIADSTTGKGGKSASQVTARHQHNSNDKRKVA